ncbi:hypothetical protein [Rhodocytophaga aerolata]
MYTGEETKERIVPFLDGYEIGTENQCNFTLLLSKCLKDKYHYEYRALGWPYQIEQFAKKRRISWIAAFKRVSLELLNESHSGEFQQKFNDFIRKWTESRVENIKIPFGYGWVENWLGICDVKQDWFRKIWTKEELKLLTQLNNEIQTIKKECKERIKPTDRLLVYADNFVKHTRKNAT